MKNEEALEQICRELFRHECTLLNERYSDAEFAVLFQRHCDKDTARIKAIRRTAERMHAVLNPSLPTQPLQPSVDHIWDAVVEAAGGKRR